MFDELEQRLRASPTDFEAALVYADALSAADDPRGQLIVAQCALVKATNNQDFEAASALGEQVAAWVLRYGDRWNGRPGGFPFRDEWRPLRSYLRYGVGVDGPGMGNFTHVGGREAESLYGPVRSFLETMTTSRGPVEVHVNILRGTGHSLDEILDEQRTDVPRNVTELVTDLIALLGEGEIRDRVIFRVQSEQDVGQTVHDPLDELFTEWEWKLGVLPELSLLYEFQMTFPGTPYRLPYQSGVFYPRDVDLFGSLLVNLHDRLINLYLPLPFEELDGEFWTYYNVIRKTLGKRFLSSTKWYRVAPSKDGSSETVRRVRLSASL